MNRLGMRLTLSVAVAALTMAAVALAARGAEIDCTAGGPCVGTPGPEFMQGGDLADQISALGGNDAMEGEGAADLLKGGRGADVLEGGSQGDVMRGGRGSDREPLNMMRGTLPSQFGPGFFGDAGNDEMYGGRGEDYLEGEEGRDKFFGGDGNDYLDAINDDTDGTADRLDCGKGFDRYSARPGDKVEENCERKLPSAVAS